jgi:hypothetical protein
MILNITKIILILFIFINFQVKVNLAIADNFRIVYSNFNNHLTIWCLLKVLQVLMPQ